MEITQTLAVASRSEWRQWLTEHHATAKEIWLIYYATQSGKPRIPYLHAVEEALCFGWIDSRLSHFLKKTRENKMFGTME